MSALQRIFLSKDAELVKILSASKPEGLDIHFLHATPEILNHFTSWLQRQPEVALDIETSHVDPYCGKILLTSFYADDRVITFDNQSIPVNEMVSTEKLKNTVVVAHNAKFETMWFLKENIHFKKVHCTMITEQKALMGAGLSNDLRSVLIRRGITPPDEMDKSIRTEFTTTYTQPEIRHILYNQADTLHLLELKKIQDEMLITLDIEFLVRQIHFPLIRVLAMAEMEGMVINEQKFTALAEEAEQKMHALAATMTTWIQATYPQVDMQQLNKPMFDKIQALQVRCKKLEERKLKLKKLRDEYVRKNKTHLKAYTVAVGASINTEDHLAKAKGELFACEKVKSISWTASQQVIKLLMAIGCTPLPKAKDKKHGNFKPSMAKAARERWLLQNPTHPAQPLIKLYDEFTQQTKHVNSFGKSFLEKYKHPITGKYHTSYKQGTVETGRLASGSSDQTPPRFNSQQLPPIIRDSFGTDPNYLIATCDLSGAELITMCSLAQDHRLLELSKKTDLHSYFANLGWKAIYISRGVPWTQADEISKEQNPKKRRAYKPMLFGTVYGLRGPKAAETLNISEKEGVIAIQTITREIPATMKMVNEAAKFALEHGFVVHNIRTNSRRWFPEVIRAKQGNYELDFMSKTTADGAARNTRIQGTQADMLCEAMVVLQRFIDFHKLDIKILMQVHDELVVKFHPSYQSWFPDRLKSIMTRTANRYLTGGVEMDAECKSGLTWVK